MNSAGPTLAKSVLKVPTSRIRELANMALHMEGVLKLNFGESDLPTPRTIKDAAIDAINQGYTYYSETAGIPGLRTGIAAKYAELHGIELDPGLHIVVTSSGVQGMNLAMRCILDPGDECIMLTPTWPYSSAIAGLCSARAVHIPYTQLGSRYEIDYEAVESAIGPATRMILYTSPSNPLGWVAAPADQKKLLELCREHGLWLMADEVYERLYYRGPVAPSILRLATRNDAVVVVQSFSKSYCMTGWRLGWLVSNPELAHKAAQLNDFVVAHAPPMFQKAGETALRDGEEEIRKMVSRLRENRDLAHDALQQIPGVSVPLPEGAFYLFPRIEGLQDSFEFCRQLLLQEKVGIAPGCAFGAGGEGSVRICYAPERTVLEPAMERIDRFIRRQ